MPVIDGFNVIGAIHEKYVKLGGARFCGKTLTHETATPDGRGRFNHFQHCSIYWTQQTGAWEVHGDVKKKWAALGWERSVLGYPITDETVTPDGRGRFNHFQHGSIYWTQQTGAWEVHGYIRERWSALGWERSFLGYPISDEMNTPDGKGRVSYFQGGAIYWFPGQAAAVEIRGAKPGDPAPSPGGAMGLPGLPDISGNWRSRNRWNGDSIRIEKVPGGYSFRWANGVTGSIRLENNGRTIRFSWTENGRAKSAVVGKDYLKQNQISMAFPPPDGTSYDTWTR